VWLVSYKMDLDSESLQGETKRFLVAIALHFMLSLYLKTNAYHLKKKKKKKCSKQASILLNIAKHMIIYCLYQV